MAHSPKKFRPRLVKRKPRRKTRWGPSKTTIDALKDARRAKARKKIDQIMGKIRFAEWLAAREAAFAARPLVCLGARSDKPVKYVRDTKARLNRCRGCVNGHWFSASKHCSEDTADARTCPYCQSFVTTVFFRVGCSCEKDSECDSDDGMSD